MGIRVLLENFEYFLIFWITLIGIDLTDAGFSVKVDDEDDYIDDPQHYIDGIDQETPNPDGTGEETPNNEVSVL